MHCVGGYVVSEGAVVEVSSDVSVCTVLEVMLLVRVSSDVSVCTVLKLYCLCLSPPWYNTV